METEPLRDEAGRFSSNLPVLESEYANDWSRLAEDQRGGDIRLKCIEQMRNVEQLYDGHRETTWRLFRRAVLFFFHRTTFLSILLSVVATFLCSQALLNLRADLFLSPVVSGFIFPLGFGVQVVWYKRERATDLYSKVSSYIFSYLYVHDEWLDSDNVPEGFDKANHMRTLMNCLVLLLCEVASILPRHHQEKTYAKRLTNVYALLRSLVRMNEVMGQAVGHSQSGLGPGLNRLRSMDRKLHYAIAALIDLSIYHIPWGLQLLGWVATFAGPVLLAPYFAFVGCPPDQSEEACRYGGLGGYFSAMLFSAIIALLFQTILYMEDPFDCDGDDDVDIRRLPTEMRLLQALRPVSIRTLIPEIEVEQTETNLSESSRSSSDCGSGSLLVSSSDTDLRDLGLLPDTGVPHDETSSEEFEAPLLDLSSHSSSTESPAEEKEDPKRSVGTFWERSPEDCADRISSPKVNDDESKDGKRDWKNMIERRDKDSERKEAEELERCAIDLFEHSVNAESEEISETLRQSNPSTCSDAEKANLVQKQDKRGN